MHTHKHQGIDYRDFICRIVESKRARNYLEVGVRDGATLARIECDAIGVDPHFIFDLNPVGRKRALHLFQETSDEFFRNRDATAIFGSAIDVVFLDGLHQFEYVLRDLINSERVCHRNSLIMLDDCLPVNSEMTERTHRPDIRKDRQHANWWTGDVWKIIPILKKYRPDLRITMVDTAPTGNVCITNIDPGSDILRDNLYHIIDEFRDLVMDDVALERFYADHTVISTASVLEGFNASLFVGP